MYGDHIWFETNVSGDYCYVGEQHCIARLLVSICLCVSSPAQSSVQPPALTLLFVLFGVECDLYIAPGFSLLCYTECLYSRMLPRAPAQCLLLSTSSCININN